MHSSVLNILVSGVGGQGTVLAGKLLSSCALLEGAFVRSAETIGMAQRGGSVLGHVRIIEPESAELLNSPLIPPGQAHILIGFEPTETLRAFSYCAKGADVITATGAIAPPTASLKRLAYDGVAPLSALKRELTAGSIGSLLAVDNSAVLGELGFDKALNVVLLGAALKALELNTRHASDFLTYEAMQRTIECTVKAQFVELNLRALKMGYELICT